MIETSTTVETKSKRSKKFENLQSLIEKTNFEISVIQEKADLLDDIVKIYQENYDISTKYCMIDEVLRKAGRR